MMDYERIAQALHYVSQNHKNQPDLEDVAEKVHLSPFHFQRLFTKWAGVSPKKFLQYLTIEHAKKLLNENKSLAEVTHQSGLSGTGRLHDLFVTIEGMTPGEYKKQGANLIICYSFDTSAFGDYLIASTPKGICNLLFYQNDRGEVINEMYSLWPRATLVETHKDEHSKVKRFFSGDFTGNDTIHLHLKGTGFQLKVWEALLKIPEGALKSYGDIASMIDQPTAQRAVGTSIGRNPVGYLIPCHRVIRNQGKIGDYRWGTIRKMAIIGKESANVHGESEPVV